MGNRSPLSSIARFRYFPEQKVMKKSRPSCLYVLVGVLSVVCTLGIVLFSIYITMINRPLRFRLCNTRAGEGALGCGEDSHPSGAAPLDAAAYICTGPGCNLQLLCVSALSLRVAAGWEGPVYVLTDRAAEVQQECTAKQGVQLETLEIPPVKHQMQMKNMKRRLLDLLPHSPQAAVYIDADIVPVGCLHRFLYRLGQEAGGAPSIGMFRDNVCVGCNTFNGGFVYQRSTAEGRQCLNDWEVESSANNFTKYVKDQDALDKVLAEGKCGAIRTLPSESVVFVDALLFPAFLRSALTAPLFEHFTTGVRLSVSWDRIYNSIVDQLHMLQMRSDLYSCPEKSE